MRISTESVATRCRERGVSLQSLLRGADVSRNAYYTLARHDSILPKSLTAIAKALCVSPSELLTEDSRGVEQAKLLLAKVDHVVERHRNVNRDNVRHTLLLLRKDPIDRLRRALIRAQGSDIR
jgi:lambda repressor-like predicted transcriptional regulator